MGAAAFGAALPTVTPRSILAQDIIVRDPDPIYNPTAIRPSQPTVLKRWDMSTNDLPATAPWELDANEIFRNGSVVRVNITQPQSFPLLTYQPPEPGLGIGLYQINTVLKGERISGTFGGTVVTTHADGREDIVDTLMEFRRRRFDWSTYTVQFGLRRATPEITNISFTLDVRGTGIMWLGAIELIDLGLPASHVYFNSEP